MIDLNRVLRRLPNYARRFGLLKGVGMALAVERQLPRKAERLREFNVPGWRAPMLLRDSISDHATFWQCIVLEQYRLARFPQYERLMSHYRAEIAQGRQPLIIDCGANIGLASLWFANAFPEAHVVAIEPDRENFSVLQQNIAVHGDRITALHGGVWPVEGYLRIENPNAGSAAFQVVPCAPDDPQAVHTFTIPGICAMQDGARPFIVKVDIEGAQGALFSDQIDWVADAALIMLELDDWQLPWVGTSRSFFSAVSRWPFDYLIGEESIFCFRDFEPKAAGSGMKGS